MEKFANEDPKPEDASEVMLNIDMILQMNKPAKISNLRDENN